jgi:hypothetical protein
MKLRHRHLLALCCVLGLAPAASAQQGLGTLGQYSPPPGLSRPILSPYMNMTRPGTNPAINYYGLVRPQIDTNQNLSQLQQQFQQLDTGINQGMTTGAPQAGSMLTTGHPVVFMNYGTYFPLFTRGGSPYRGGAGGGTGALGGIGRGGIGLGGGGLGLGNTGGVGIGLGIGLGR